MSTETVVERAPGTPALPSTPFRFVVRTVRHYPWRYGLMLFFETLAAGSAIMIPYALSRIIKAVTGAQEQSMALVDALSAPLMLFVALSVSELIFGRMVAWVQRYTGPLLRQSVVRDLYHYLQYHSHRYLSNNFAGALTHRIAETSMGVLQILLTVATEFWPIFISIVVAVVLLFNAHVYLGSFALAWAVAFVVFSYLVARRNQPYAKKGAAARSETTAALVDSVSNLTSSRLFARLGFERENLDRLLVKEYAAIQISMRYAERVRWFQFTAAAVLKIGVLYFSLRLWGSGRISVGDFVMAVSLSLLVINEARNLSRRFVDFFEYAGNVVNGVASIVQSHELVDKPDAKPVPIQHGRIRYDNVTFGYSPEKAVFRNLSVDIPAGQRVGLVGLSGSGKTTFVSLLLRLYDVQEGRITIDDVDIRDVTQESLHGQLALIPQDPSLFHRTLIDNIRYGKLDATDEEVVEAAKKAHAHEFVMQIKEQYQSMVGERGVKLSGGQRQRVAIARVILKNAPVLILDEATSALDSITEKAIQDTMDEVMRGKTVIVVAHRLSTISHLDRILVFDNGSIIEDGTHAALLEAKGAYWRLWSRQAGGFLPQDMAGAEGAPKPVAPVGAAEEAGSVEEVDEKPEDELPPPRKITPA